MLNIVKCFFYALLDMVIFFSLLICWITLVDFQKEEEEEERMGGGRDRDSKYMQLFFIGCIFISKTMY